MNAPATGETAFDLDGYLGRRRQEVDTALRARLAAMPGCPDALAEAMRYSVLAPGKRLRPILVLLAAEAAGGDAERALPAACAVEFVHVYSLIHDDLPAMDDDDLRRGLPTCHKKFGDALAILAGDALQTLAFETLAASYPPATASASCATLARAAGAGGMVGGQVEDLAWERGGGRLDDLERVHARKTGALFRASLQLGVLAVQGEGPNGPDPVLMSRLDAFGRAFGLLFQITDDLLDAEGSIADTGKRVGKDAARGKLTYPSILGVTESRRRAAQSCADACAAVEGLGDHGRLQALAQFVLERDR